MSSASAGFRLCSPYRRMCLVRLVVVGAGGWRWRPGGCTGPDNLIPFPAHRTVALRRLPIWIFAVEPGNERSWPGRTSAVAGRESAAFQPCRPAPGSEGRADETGSRARARATGSVDGTPPNGCRPARGHHPGRRNADADAPTRVHSTLSAETTHVQAFYQLHPLHASTL